jgi:hypothetical protein
MSFNSLLRRSLKAGVLLFVALSCMSGCVTVGKPYPRNELIDQILKPRPGHEGKLTNTSCPEMEGDKCPRLQIDEYDLSDPALRDKLNALDFVCSIGGHHYKVCKDKVGFCRFTQTKKCSFFGLFCKNSEVEQEFVPADPYQFLLDAKTRCFNKERYPFGSFR